MGVVIIKFDGSDYQKVINEQTKITAFVNDLFFDKITHDTILTQLQNYHNDEDGAPVVPEFEIDHVAYHQANHSGQVRLSYTVDFTFACADKRATTRHIETSNYTIDPQNKTLTLSIHDKIRRDTYEEF